MPFSAEPLNPLHNANWRVSVEPAMASSFVTGTIGSRLNGHQNGGGFNCYQITGIHPPAAGNGISHGIFSCPNNGGDCVSGSSRPHSSTDEQSGFNADGMMRQLFPENDRDSGAHRRAFTPTEEQLTMSLHRLGMDAPDDLAAGDILDLARRGLARSQAVSGSPSRAMPCNGNEGLSDSHSNGATTPGDPMTPVMSPSDLARGSPFSADRGTFSGQGGPNVVRKMHPTGAGSHPHEKRGLVDLYAPMGIQGLGCHPNWDSEQPTNPKDPRNSPNYGITFPALGQYTENPHVVFQNPHRMVSPRRSSPPISGAQFVQNELMQEIERLKRLAHDLSIRNQEYKTKYDYACHVGVQTILIREGEIGELKQQLRKADILPFNEQFTADDSCYENELMMCFRMLCCWGKRFYKFPTSMSLPRPLQIRISEICEDTHSEAFLMNSPQSKYLVVVALATRWLAEEILNTHFLSIVVSGFNGNENGLKEMLDGVKAGTKSDDSLFDAIQSTASRRSMHFLQMIHPLLSRPQDKSHCEQTEKQFVQVAQHAARITLMAAKKGTDFEFKFPTLGEKFVEERMLTVTSDSLGLDTAPKRVTALYNGVSGQMVRLAMLPEVTALTRDARGDWRQRRVYKANVLLC